VPFSRANIYARDDHRCQYCGDGFPTSELTFDHVVPVAQGGRKDWENIVTCCVTCNRKKGGRTPAEAGMHRLRMPKRPESAPAIVTQRRAGATISTGTSSSTTPSPTNLRSRTCDAMPFGLPTSYFRRRRSSCPPESPAYSL